MYFDKELHRGYNAYIDAAKDDLGTMMDEIGKSTRLNSQSRE